MNSAERKSNNNDFLLLSPNENQNIPQYKQTIPVNVYSFYIIDEITQPSKYLELIHTLKTAEEHDQIFIYLNTPGGCLTTTVQILSAMHQCNGTVITVLEGEACSAGTLLFLSGDRFIVNPDCTFMIHNYSQGAFGKGNELTRKVKYFEAYFEKLARRIYKDFLTDEEMASVLEGKDYWMDSDEVIERLERMASIQAMNAEEANVDGEAVEPEALVVSSTDEVVEAALVEAVPEKAKTAAKRKR